MSDSSGAPPLQLAPAAGLMAARALRAPVWLLASALLARLLGPDGLGTWAMVLAAAMLANQGLLLWTQAITQRYGRAEWLETGSLSRTWALRWPILLAGLAVVLALVAFAPGRWHERFYDLADEQRWLVLAVVLGLWWMGEAQGLQQVRARFGALAWTPLVADAALVACAGALLALAASGAAGFAAERWLLVVALVGPSVWAVVLARELGRSPGPWRLPDRQAWRAAVLFAVPLVPGYIVGYLAEWCDLLLIGHLLGYREVGLFHAAYQYMLLMIGLPTAFAAVLLPQIVTAVDRVEPRALERLVERTAPQLAVLWGAASLPVLALLPVVFSMLTGRAFDAAAPLLAVLCVAVPGAVASHVYGVAHFVQGRLGTANGWLFGAKLAVNAAISATLLPLIGPMGSAIGCAVSYLVLQWLFLLDQHRRLRLPLGTGAVALALVHAAALVLAAFGGAPSRMLVAAVAVTILFAWARRVRLFDADALAAWTPGPLARLRPLAARVLGVR